MTTVMFRKIVMYCIAWVILATIGPAGTQGMKHQDAAGLSNGMSQSPYTANRPQGERISRNPRTLKDNIELASATLENALNDTVVVNSSSRSHLEALIADTLWRIDEPRARQLFQKALEHASEARSCCGGPAAARARVLKLIWLRSSELARSLLESHAGKDSTANLPQGQGQAKDSLPSLEVLFGREARISGEDEKALLARELLSTSADDAAKLLRENIQRGPASMTIASLIELRQKAPKEANELLVSLLDQLRSLPEVTALSLLAGPIPLYVFGSCDVCPQREIPEGLGSVYTRVALDVLRRSMGQAVLKDIPPGLAMRARSVVSLARATVANRLLSLGRYYQENEIAEIRSILENQAAMLNPRQRSALIVQNGGVGDASRLQDVFKSIDSVADPVTHDKEMARFVEWLLQSGDQLETNSVFIEKGIRKIGDPVLQDRLWSMWTATGIAKHVTEGRCAVAYKETARLSDGLIRAQELFEVSKCYERNGDKVRRWETLEEAIGNAEKAKLSANSLQLVFKIAAELAENEHEARALELLASGSQDLSKLDRESLMHAGSDNQLPEDMFELDRPFRALGRFDFDAAYGIAQSIPWKELELRAKIAASAGLFNSQKNGDQGPRAGN